jgi:hypothetical protein
VAIKKWMLRAGNTIQNSSIGKHFKAFMPEDARQCWGFNMGTSINLKNSSFPRRRESNSFADRPFAKLGFPPARE